MAIPTTTRSTRSSTTPKSPPPASSSSRPTRPSSLAVDNNSSRLSTSTATRRTPLTSSSTSASTTATAKPRTTTRPSTSTAPAISGPRPLLSSSRQNTTTDSARSRLSTATAKPATGLRKPIGGTASTRTSLAVPSGSRVGSRVGSVAGRESVAPGVPGVTPATPVKRTVDKGGVEKYDPTREPMKAYLRLKPNTDAVTNPEEDYLRILNESEVLMVQPANHRLGPSASSMSIHPMSHPSASSSAPSDSLTAPQSGATPQGTLFKFTAVADATASDAASAQADFFRATTLPLVKDFLQGENCLLFAYGTTGSGKTYTVQGGDGEKAGLLPRVVDLVLRSLQGSQSKANLRPSGTGGVEVGELPKSVGSTKPSAQSLGHRGISNLDSFVGDSDIIPVDDRFEYSIWVSYAEIYNEKIFDLLDLEPHRDRVASTASTTSGSHLGGGLLSGLKSVFGGRKQVKRTALALKLDHSAAAATGGKHISGLHEVPIRSSADIRDVLNQGKQNRVTYATMSNGESSRSHSVFTVKVLRIPKGVKAAEQAARTRVTRFSVVDLAGSERVVNTGTTGERLVEAGQINKSLFWLGQCMEALRKNQDNKGKKAPSMPPFRQSKLTELFQSFFVGDGKAAMIVNVDPHATSYDMNMQVMKFSAVANGVMTIRDNKPVPITPAPAPAREPRLSRVSFAPGEEEEEVEYEELDPVEEDDDGEPEDEYLNLLLDELSAMRTALYEAQAQTILAVAAAKQDLIREYEDKLHQLELEHQQRRREDQDEMEARFDAKLDIIRKVEEARVPLTPGSGYDDSDEDEEEEDELEEDEEEEVKEEEDTADEASFARSEDEVKEMLSPTPAARMAKINLDDTEEEVEEEEEEDELDEAEQSAISIDPSAAGDTSIISLSGDEAAEDSIVEHSFDSHDYDDESASDSRRTTASSTRTPRASVAEDELEEDGDEEEDEADEDDPFSISKPAARSPEAARSAKKPKRKLGGKVTDAEAIEAAVDGY